MKQWEPGDPVYPHQQPTEWAAFFEDLTRLWTSSVNAEQARGPILRTPMCWRASDAERGPWSWLGGEDSSG